VKTARHQRSLVFELTSALDSFLDEYAYSGSPETERNYRQHLRPFREYCERAGITTLEEIDADFLRQYIKAQSRSTYTRKGHEDEPRRLASSTLAQRHAALNTFFNWCVNEGRLAASPMATVRRPRGEKRVRYALEPEEVRALLRASKEAPGILKHRDYALLLTFLGTGARLDEVRKMRWSDIHWGEVPNENDRRGRAVGYIVLYGKGRKERRARMSKELRRALRRWKDVCPQIPGDYVWVSLRRTQMSKQGIWSMLKNLAKYAGVDTNVHAHRFRHTFAAQFTAANRDVFATSRRLGHERIKTTEDYLHSLGVDYGTDESYKTPDEWLHA